MTEEFWARKRVLITGHTGFKGSWLSLWLQKMGANVLGYSLDPPSKPSMFHVADCDTGMQSVLGDVRDLTRMREVFNTFKPEIVFHLAAQSLVRPSYDSPVDTYSTNVMGTVNLLEAVRLTDSVQVIINITSDKCYENREWDWGYREIEAMGGYDPYSSSKGCAELVTSAYRRSFFSNEQNQHARIAIASARAGNVIGGGDWATDRLIPDIMRAISEDKPVNIRNPDAIRPWQHVLEPLGGYLTLAEKSWSNPEAFSEGWNFGPQDADARPVQWIVEHITKTWGDNAHWELDKDIQPHEARYLKLDISKTVNRLNYTPRLTLPVTLEWVVEWYKGYQNNDNMRMLSEKQIQRFQNLGAS